VNPYRVTWAIEHTPDGSYVVERETDRPVTVYGPMPAALVTAFIRDREAVIREVFQAHLNRSFLHGQNPPQED
jgi:hypothetical protein